MLLARNVPIMMNRNRPASDRFRGEKRTYFECAHDNR
jgi:hypothetical protein